MKEKNNHNFVNHIMAGETRFHIESPFDKESESENGSVNLKFHWSPKGVEGEFPPHAWTQFAFPRIEK